MWEQVLRALCSPSHAVILNCSLVKMDDVGSLSYWFWEHPQECFSTVFICQLEANG